MITLEQAKLHCRIEPDIDYEDELLGSYIAAARDHVQMHLDRTIYELAVPEDDKWGLLDNKSIDQATLLLVGHWYANREAVTDLPMNNLPLGFERLLSPYMRMGV